MIKIIPGHLQFKATEDGQIIGKRGKSLTGHVDHCGYRNVLLSENGKTKNYLVHRLIAEAFIPNPDNLPCINHKDGNKLNNSVENLEWCTRSENTRHSYKNGLQNNVTNQYGNYKVLNKEDISYIKANIGTKTDKEIAKVLGCSREIVGRKRRELLYD